MGTVRSVDVRTRYSALAGPPPPLNIRSDPTTVTEPNSVVAGAATFKLPSTVSEEVFHIRPGPGVAGIIDANDPETAPNENRGMLSPSASGSPVRFNRNVPP